MLSAAAAMGTNSYFYFYLKDAAERGWGTGVQLSTGSRDDRRARGLAYVAEHTGDRADRGKDIRGLNPGGRQHGMSAPNRPAFSAVGRAVCAAKPAQSGYNGATSRLQGTSASHLASESDGHEAAIAHADRVHPRAIHRGDRVHLLDQGLGEP